MDILIKNGTVVDGTGAPGVRADVAAQHGHIAEVGPDLGMPADQAINAEGLVVAPGFVDITNHADTYLTLLNNPPSESLLAQGITTIVIGNCGASLAPMTHGRLINVVQKWADVREINIDWQYFGEFLDVIDRFSPGVNVAGLVGHTTLRRDVLRDEIRDAKEDEIEQMQALLHRALQDGAYGLSFGLSYSHARSAKREEIVELAKAAREAGTLVSMHLRDERELQAEAAQEALEIAKEVDVSLEISHLKSVGDEAGGVYKATIAAIERAAQADDLDVHFSVFPFETQHAVLYLLFPEWAQRGGFDALRKHLQDAATRQKIVHELSSMNIPFEDYIIAEAKRGKSSVGKTILEAAKYANVAPAEFIVNLFLAHEGQVLLFHRCKGEAHLEEAIAHPLAHVTSAGGGYSLGDVESGALVHPRSFGAMPELLGHYVREKSVLSLENAIKKISGAPAAKLGMIDRGVIAKGNVADLAIFDPATIANRATLEKPYQFPQGMKWVLVNGAVAVDPDGITGRRAGLALR